MKRFEIYIIALMAVLSSCSDFLDREPYGELSEDNFYQNKDQAVYAANACYKTLQTLNGFWATGVQIFGDLCSDDCTQNGSIDASYARASFDPGDNYLVTGSFVNAYTGIARCNIGIEKVSNMPDDKISSEDRNRISAEMRFIRGYWYYHLIRLYGDVPILLTQVDLKDEAALHPARSSVDEVYEKVIVPDLTFAAQHLPSSYGSEDAPRATSGAAYAFLSAAYLYRQDYTNAIKAGEEVVKLADEGVYELLADMESIYMETNEYNKESIFEASFSKDQQNWKTRYFGTVEGGFCRGEIYTIHFNPTANLRDAYALIDGNPIGKDVNSLYDAAAYWKNRDPRFDITFYTPLDVSTHRTTGEPLVYSMDWLLNKEGGVDFQKNTLWYGPNETNVGLNNILMRYAEVLLNLAEAYIQTGDFQTGAKYINQIRTRARNYALAHPDKYIPAGLPESKVLPDITISGKEDGMEKLRYERRVEFAGEDVRGYDLRRWNIEESTWAKVQGFTWDKKMSLLPIPNTEISKNPNLKPQNPGY